MKYLLSTLIMILGTLINRYVPVDWQYIWGYIVGSIAIPIPYFYYILNDLGLRNNDK